ncbi:MAG: exodeoxyribonuclease beta subunit [Proteobacteria bacterium]|nr:exodeoxyribonuclease beta subunit [Pseudomonadota bacterium]
MSTTAAAVDFDVFACPLQGRQLIEASAGTGKTWNICGLYLRLLLEKGLPVDQILVVTFTNAATAELRERIRSRIVETLAWLKHGSQGGDPFVPALMTSLEQRFERSLLATRLQAALHAFDEAAIFTIHGFCQRALSDTPFAAGLPFALKLVENDQEILLQAVQDFWRRHVAGGVISPELADYLLACKDSPESWAKLLKRHLAKPMSRPVGLPGVGKVSGSIVRAPIDAAFADAAACWEGAAQVILDALPNLKYYKPETVEKARQDWERYLADGDALATAKFQNLYLFRVSVLENRTRVKCTTPVHPLFAAAETLLALIDEAMAQLEQARLGLLGELFVEAGSALREKKRRQRLISFDDILHNVHAALCGSDGDRLAAYLRTRYPAALIDEFQDTDPLQFAIFNRIFGASNAFLPLQGGGQEGDGADCRPTSPHPHPSPPLEREGATLFLVGDPKQAIYSFRNADLHTYLKVREQVTERHTLRHNQRSVAGLIEGCNALFGRNAGAFILPGLAYEPVLRGERQPRELIDQTEPTDTVALRVWRLPWGEGLSPDRNTALRMAANATSTEVARLLSAGQAGQITLDGENLQPGDIAILVRSHSQGRRIRVALAALGVGSVELSPQSIFASIDAEELERVLLAILEPARTNLLFAALATEAMGYDAGRLEALNRDEPTLLDIAARFFRYREQWRQRGIAFMFRQWLFGEEAIARLLARPDGERRLTNFLHLAELLQQEAALNPSPDALVRWLAAQRNGSDVGEVAQLRLESDRNLVHIVTIHKSKGLEYEFVFCPFLWDGHPGKSGGLEGAEYHDDAEQPVIDFRTLEKAEKEEISRRLRRERDAELMRLVYVAVTRAVQRCTLIAGCYLFKKTENQGKRSLLNFLVAGGGGSYGEWLEHKRPAAEILAEWEELARTAAPHLALTDLPRAAGIALTVSASSPEDFSARPPPRHIPPGWRSGSFSSLGHGAEQESAAVDHDGRSVVLAGRANDGPPADPDDFCAFPRGASAGECVHCAFEHIDFTDPQSWNNAIAAALTQHPQHLPGLTAAESTPHLSRMLRRLLDDVLATPLAGEMVLNRIAYPQRLTEMAFRLPALGLTPQALNDWLKKHHYDMPRLTFRDLDGYLQGYIDLVFRHDGRYYLLDWKSNHLGNTPEAYSSQRLAEEMAGHGYHLQYLLYTLALRRYLALRLPDFDYERDFGGVFYLFVRGVRPGWKTPEGQPTGVYFHRPPEAAMDSLEALIAGKRKKR